jgi:hypothetical protein
VSLVVDAVPGLRIDDILANESPVRLTFAKGRAPPDDIFFGVCYTTQAKDAFNGFNMLIQVIEAEIEFHPHRGKELFGRRYVITSKRSKCFDPPRVVSGVFPVNYGLDFAVIHYDVAHIEVTVSKHIRCPIRELSL